MHDAAFAACGIAARYEAWDVAPAGLAAAVARLRSDATVLGANVTVPHKQSVVGLVDVLGGEAAAIGAVNTLHMEEGRLVGTNTDAEGFLRSLTEAGLDPSGKVVVLIGAGGAARAVAWALLHAGADEVRVTNRTDSAARALVDDLRPAASFGRRPGRPERRSRLRAVERDDDQVSRGVDWWVNATSVGMARGDAVPDETPLPATAFSGRAGERAPAAAAIDLVYRPRRTRFLREAAEAGLVTVDGLGMLLYQGAAAFESWNGREAPIAAMRAALEGALAAEVRT